MCILTFVPQKDNQICITHSRDESVLRPAAIPPSKYLIGNQHIRFPKDPQGGGTWFAQGQDWVLCLLNGAFEDHITKSTYRASRGTIIKDFFQYKDLNDFLCHFNANGLEPFTLVLFDIKNQKNHQLVWDEKVLNIQHFDAQKPHIWLSSTLYNNDLKKEKSKLFYDFLDASHDVIRYHNSHKFNHLEHQNPKRRIENIHTIAITQVKGSYEKLEMEYIRMMNDELI